NSDNSGSEFDYVLAKGHDFLWRGLPADSTIDVRLAWEKFFQLPHVRDRVAKKHHTIFPFRGRFQGSIRITIAIELPEIVHVNPDSRGAVLIKSGMPSGRRCRILRGGSSAQQTTADNAKNATRFHPPTG